MAKKYLKFTHRGGNFRRNAFWVSIALASLFLIVSLLSAYPLIVINWLPKDLLLTMRTDLVSGDEVHRLHSLALGVLAWGMLTGILLQVHQPDRKVSALLASLAVPIAITVSLLLAGTFTVVGMAPFFVLILLVVVLHPTANDFVRLPKWDLPMVSLIAIAALPWVIYTIRTGKAAHNVDVEFEVDHMTFMSALGLLVILWGMIGASDHSGWKYAAGASLFATACVGLQSLIFPDALSRLSFQWAVAALVWCIVYGSAVILRSRG